MIFYGISPVLNVFATSPPFPLQGIYNNHTDWSLEKAPGFESANPVYQPDTTESTQSIASWFHRDAFSSTDIGSTWYYGGNNIQNNIVPVAFNDLITVSQIEDVFRQIIIETAIKGSQSSADRSLTQIVQEITNDPTGSVSQTIFRIAQLQASGDISAANNAIDKVALHLVVVPCNEAVKAC